MTTTDRIITIGYSEEPHTPQYAELYLHLHGHNAPYSEKAEWVVRQFERWQAGDHTARYDDIGWIMERRRRATDLPGGMA